MYCENSKNLIRELKTSKWLPPYNQTLISEIASETQQLSADISSIIRDQEKSLACMTLSSCANRNKRAVLLYLNHRLSKVEKLKWETGGTIPPHFNNQLSSYEQEYYRQYSALIQLYSRKVCKNLDLTADLHPPKDLFVEVRVNENCGEIVLPESGSVSLEKNTMHLLRRTEASQLVRQGLLQHTN